MIYFVVIQFLILLIIILFLHFKQSNRLLHFEGIPISLAFPYKEVELIEETNYIICLSVDCPHCRKIIDDLQKLDFETSNVFAIFQEEYNTVIDFLEQYKFLNFEYLSDISTNSLYVKATPFVYTLNERGIIIDKMVIKDIKYLDII